MPITLEEYKKRNKKNSSNITYREDYLNDDNVITLEEYKKYNGIKMPDERKDTPGWFKSGNAFDDGYDFGDITKTILGSTGDLLADIGRGFEGTIEGATDWAQYRIADVLNFFGANDTAEAIKENAKFDSTGAIFGTNEDESQNLFKKGWSEDLDKNSVFADKSDSVLQGVGNVGAMIGVGALTGGGVAGSALASYTSAYGNARSEAYKNGADDSTANKTAMVSGFAEAISEQVFSGIPGMKTAGWGDKLLGKVGQGVSKYFGTTTGKIALKVLDAAGEGTEEIISNVLTATGNDIVHLFDNKFTYGMEKQTGNFVKDSFNAIKSADSWNSFISAALTSAICNGGSNFITNTQKNSVLRAYAKDNGITYQEAKTKFQNTYNANLNTNKEDYKNKNKNQLPFSEEMNIEKGTEQDLIKKMKDKTFVETGDETNPFHFNNTGDEVADKVYQKFADKGINNTVEAHKLANLGVKIAKEIGTEIEVTNNQEISETLQKMQSNKLGRELTQEEIEDCNNLASRVNGTKLGNTVLLNTDSKEAGSFIIGHEFKHFVEVDKEANDYLNKAIFDRAKRLGIYDTDLKTRQRIYENIKGADAEGELAADYIGQFFKDPDFINDLSTKNPNMFVRIYKAVQKAFYNITGQKDKSEFLTIKTNLENAYRRLANNHQISSNEDINVLDNVASTLSNELDTTIRKNTQDSINVPVEQNQSQEGSKNDNLPSAKMSIGNSLEEKTRKNIKEKYNDENIEYVDINKIKNIYTTGKGHRGSITEQVKENGITDPLEITINDYGEPELDDGNHRLEAAIDLGMKKVPLRIREANDDNTEMVYKKISDLKTDYFKNNDAKYSISDNKGRELTKEQQDYFKDSKVRDDEGNLMVMYHGSPTSNITTFDNGKSGSNTMSGEYGIYFTDSKKFADDFSYERIETDSMFFDKKGKKGTVYDAYLNIKNPLDFSNITEEEINNLYDYASDLGKIDGKENFVSNMLKWQKIGNHQLMKSNLDLRKLESAGYDGFIAKLDVKGNEKEYVVFNPNQIKNVDNTNPTSNPDIRYSLEDNNGITLSKDAQREIRKYVGLSNEQLDKEFGYAMDSRDSMQVEYNNLNKLNKEFISSKEFNDAMQDYLHNENPSKKTDELMERANKEADKLRYYNNQITKYNAQMEAINSLTNSSAKDTRTNDEIVKEAEKHFGTTTNFKETAYITTNGNNLDFSGKNEGAMPGKRNKDHREINEIGTTMDDFIEMGNVRLKPEGNGFEVSTMPNEKQISKLYDYIYQANGEIYVDVVKPNDVYDSATYKQGTPASKIIGDLKEYFDKGTFPKKSDYADFFYSLSKDGERQINNIAPDYDKTSMQDLKVKEKPVEEIPIEETKVETADEEPEEETAEVYNNRLNSQSIKAKEDLSKLMNKNIKLQGEKRTKFLNDIDKFTKITQEELLDNDKLDETPTYDEIRNIVENYAEDEIEITDDIIKEAKSRVRNSTIQVSEDLKNQITDYNQFRKSNMGKLRLANKGIKVDVLFQELSEMYPYYFDKEINNESDMLYALSDFMNSDAKSIEKYKLSQDDIDSLTNDVFESILNNSMTQSEKDRYAAQDTELKKKEIKHNANVRTVESVLGTKGYYTSNKANELYEELRELKKGVKASKDLGYILDINNGYNWSDIKQTLINIKTRPDTQVNENSGLESNIREFLQRDYETKVEDLMYEKKDIQTAEDVVKEKRFNYAKQIEGLKEDLKTTTTNIDASINEKQSEYNNKKDKDTMTANHILKQISDLKTRKANIELDYKKRINDLSTKINNFDVKAEAKKITRKEYKQSLSDKIAPLISNIQSWKDKTFAGGIRYGRETAQRNMVDVAGEEGKAINESIFNPVTEHEANKNRRINDKFETIKNLNLNLKQQYEIDGTKVGEDDLVRRYIEKSISDEDLDSLGADKEKIKNAANVISNMLETYFKELNTMFEKMGMPEVEHRKDYFPHSQEEKDTLLKKLASKVGIDITNQEIPTTIAGRTDTFKPNKAWNGHFLKRTGIDTSVDAIGNLEKYIAGVEDILAHTEDIQNVRTLSNDIRSQFDSEETKAKIESINKNEDLSDDEKTDLIEKLRNKNDNSLSNLVQWLDEYANILANKKSFADRDMEHKVGRQAYTTMGNIESIVASNTIGGNASVSLTNFAPIAQGLATTKGRFMIKACVDVLSNDVNGIKGNKDTSFIEKSDLLTNRFGNDSIGRKTLTDKIKEVAFKPMEIVDNFTSEVLVRAKYYQNLNEGMSEDAAMKKADIDTGKIMADRSKGALPTIFNEKNPLTKLMTMFQVEPNNILSNYGKDMPRDTKSKSQLINQYARLSIGSYVFNSIIMGIRGGNEVLPDPIRFIQYLIKALTGDDDDKKKAGDDILEAVTGAVPFVSNVAGLFGVEDVGRIPISSALIDVTKLPTLFDDEASDEYKQQTFRDEVLKPLSYLLLPTGSAQAWKTIQGIEAVNNGGSFKYDKEGKLKMQFPVDNPGFADYTKASLFGKYSLPNAKEYIDSGFKSLTEKQTKEYKELDLPYEDYLEYNKGINNAKNEAKKNKTSQSEAVYDYIYDLPISQEQKNIMVNSSLDKGEVKDKNGYIKYKDNYNKTFWYDSENEILYNNNYHEVDSNKLESLTKYSNEVDMTNYGDYSSLNEFTYANSNPEKYAAITKVTDYNTYEEYKSYIEDIEDEYYEKSQNVKSKGQKTAIANQKKIAIKKYINSLNLNKYQKMMLEGLGAGYSINNYKGQLKNYLNSLDLEEEELENITKALFGE